jgi:hypothetical protein
VQRAAPQSAVAQMAAESPTRASLWKVFVAAVDAFSLVAFVPRFGCISFTIGKADELPVHNRKWVGNQTNRGGYIW